VSLKTLPKIYLTGVTDSRTDGTTTAPHSRGPSPVRHGPQYPVLEPSSRPAVPNVFDSVNGSNPPINTNFTGGALSNNPVLQPNHNFSTGPPASTTGDTPLTSPQRSPEGGVNIASPTRNGELDDTTMSGPVKKTPEEEREEREHEERKAQAAREHEKLLQNQRDYDLGNFESEEPADDNMDTEPTGTSATDANMTNAPAGGATPAPSSEPDSTTPLGLFTPLVPHSTREIAYLRSRPYNESGAYDDIYRYNNYEEPDNYDESGEPIYLNPPKTPTPKPRP